MITITKKQFEEVYRKFPPLKCEVFYIKYFSASSLSHNIWPGLLAGIGLALPFIFAVLGHFLNWSKEFTYVPSFIYAGILCLVGIYSLTVWHRRIKRIKSICKELNISEKDYDKLVDKYYYHNYYPDIKDFINSILPE